jgi:hypothetical protein
MRRRRARGQDWLPVRFRARGREDAWLRARSQASAKTSFIASDEIWAGLALPAFLKG